MTGQFRRAACCGLHAGQQGATHTQQARSGSRLTLGSLTPSVALTQLRQKKGGRDKKAKQTNKQPHKKTTPRNQTKQTPNKIKREEK